MNKLSCQGFFIPHSADIKADLMRSEFTPIQAQSPERKTMNEPQNAIKVLNLDHLGIVAGIIMEMEVD